MAIPVHIKDPLERVKTWWIDLAADDLDFTYDTALRAHLHPHSSIVHASPSPILSTTTFLLTADGTLCNQLRNLHGGAAATIFDVCTTLAIVPLATDHIWRTGGVSRGLNVTYLKPVPEGMTVLVSGEVWSLGKRLAFIKGWMREWDDEKQEARGPMLCICEHGKVDIGALPTVKL